MKKLLLLILVTIITHSASSQSQVDSLLRLCEKASEKQKSGLYLEISSFLRKDSAKSNSLTRKAYQLAVKNRQIPEQAKAFYNLGETDFISSNYQNAIPNYEKAILLFKEVKDTTNIVSCYKSVGSCYANMNQGEKAIAQFIEGMRLCENDKKNTARFFSNIALTHAKMHNVNDAISNYRKALKINASIHNLFGIAINYNGLGYAFNIINRRDSALINFQKAYNIFKQIKNTDNQAMSLSNIACIYLNYRDSLSKSMDYYSQARAIFQELGLNQYEAEINEGIGIVLYKQGKYQQAIDAYNLSLQLNEKYNRGMNIKATNYKLLSNAYESLGDYKTALNYNKLYTRYSDSLQQNEKYEKLIGLEKQYETKKKENEILKLNAKQQLTEIQLHKNKQLKQLGYVTASLLLLFVFFILKKYFDKIKSNQLLEEKNRQIEKSEQELRLLNAAKNKFFSIIAHDLKNPFHTVMGYSHLLSNDYDHFSEAERRKFAVDINQSTNNIFRLLQNLLEWSKAQTGRLKYMPIEIEFGRILENAVGVLQALADQKKIQLTLTCSNNLKVFADPLMVETVLRNLINNAIKFTPENGIIEITAKQIENQVRIDVSDNGVGISEEDVRNLFQIDSKVKRKGTNNEDGSGLGLILCKEFIDKNNGTLWVESTLGIGSTFSFTIPAKASA
jgi:signal transduction histidine kinase